jgi:hypothetical protein
MLHYFDFETGTFTCPIEGSALVADRPAPHAYTDGKRKDS